jgi:hypothetical protein
VREKLGGCRTRFQLHHRRAAYLGSVEPDAKVFVYYFFSPSRKPGNKPETFVHNLTLLPRHLPLLSRGKESPMSPE